MNRDKYYGSVAENYDAERQKSQRWRLEYEAVNELVTTGPVLDIPMGTGRFFPIYQEKGLDAVGADISDDMMAVALRNHPGIHTIKASILDLPYPDGFFETAVCVRMMDWLYPDEMERAAEELKRVARTIIVSVRTGREDLRVNQTHDLDRFLFAMEGRLMVDYRFTENTADGYEGIFKFKIPNYSDVFKPLRHGGSPGAYEFQRLVMDWLGAVDIRKTSVSAEYWRSADLYAICERMAETDPQYLTEEEPRHNPTAPVILARRNNMSIVVDGRRRINAMKGKKGLFPVLVIECPV